MTRRFPTDRWAEAFIAVCVQNGMPDARHGCRPSHLTADEYAAVKKGTSILESAAAAFERHLHSRHGSTHAKAMCALLRAALQKCVPGAESALDRRSTETALRVFFLLAQKNYALHTANLCHAIQKRAQELAGILEVTLETVREPEPAFIVSLKKELCARYGAADVAVMVTPQPELIGGCRLIIDSERFDFSIAGSLQNLKKTLHTG